MHDNAPMSPDTALEIILSSTTTLGTEPVALGDALGRVVAEDVRAAGDLPPFDNSAMDGYAVLAADTVGAEKDSPRELTVIAEAPAGVMVSEEVVSGTAVRIMTGAPVPTGADAVIMVEDTERSGDAVRILREVGRGWNVRPAGEDVTRGELVLRSGVHIRPAEMGMLAALGKPEVRVYRKPRVAVITSGNELVDVSESPGPGQIRNSNQYSLTGQALLAGAEVSLTARVIDERDELERVLSSASETSDLIIVSGGVSVGDYDFVKDTLAKLGEIRFWKVAVKPGKPLAYGHVGGVPLFGLPGNPVSSMVTFDIFVRPAIGRMMGLDSSPLRTVSASAACEIRHKPGVREFVRAMTVWENDRYVATPAGVQGSGRLSSMVNANSYIVIPEDRDNVAAGDTLQVMLFE